MFVWRTNTRICPYRLEELNFDTHSYALIGLSVRKIRYKTSICFISLRISDAPYLYIRGHTVALQPWFSKLQYIIFYYIRNYTMTFRLAKDALSGSERRHIGT